MYFKHYFVEWEIALDGIEDSDRAIEVKAQDEEQAVRLATSKDVTYYGLDSIAQTFVVERS